MINSRSGKVWNKKEIAIMVAGVYAKQACDDLRKRIAEEACLEPNGMLLQVDKQSILETEIILP